MASEVQKLIRDLASAGVPIKDTKSGWLIGAPDGTSIAVHRTESDHRAMKNTMARLKRAGVQLDKETDMDIQARKTTLESVKRVLAEMGNPAQFQVSKVYGDLEIAPATAYRALTQLGYTKIGHGVWGGADDIKTTEIVEAPVVVMDDDQRVDEYIKQLESIEVRVYDSKPMPWDTKPKASDVPMFTPSIGVPVAIEPTNDDREFIDSKDSFVIDTKQIGDLTIDQLARSLEVAGLQFEIRAWR